LQQVITEDVRSLGEVKVKVKGQGHQGHKRLFAALSAAYKQFMFGKRTLASDFFLQF